MRFFRGAAFLILAVPACVGPLHHSQKSEIRTAVVRSLTFQGNKSLDAATLSIAIATSPGSYTRRSTLFRWTGLGTEPPFNETQFRRDVLRIQALYGVHGFPNARVDTVVRHTGNELDLTFKIAEGQPIKIDSVIVEGLPPK